MRHQHIEAHRSGKQNSSKEGDRHVWPWQQILLFRNSSSLTNPKMDSQKQSGRVQLARREQRTMECMVQRLAVCISWKPGIAVAKVLVIHIFHEKFWAFFFFSPLFSESGMLCRLRRNRLRPSISMSWVHIPIIWLMDSPWDLYFLHTSSTALIFILMWNKITFWNLNIFHRMDLFSSQPFT